MNSHEQIAGASMDHVHFDEQLEDVTQNRRREVLQYEGEGAHINEWYTKTEYITRRVQYLNRHPDYKNEARLFPRVRSAANEVFHNVADTLSMQTVRQRELEYDIEPLLPFATTSNTESLDNYASYPATEWQPGMPTAQADILRQARFDRSPSPSSVTVPPRTQSTNASSHQQNVIHAATSAKVSRKDSAIGSAPRSPVISSARDRNGDAQSDEQDQQDVSNEAEIQQTTNIALPSSSSNGSSGPAAHLTVSSIMNRAGVPDAHNASPAEVQDMLARLQRPPPEMPNYKASDGVSAVANRGIHVPVKERKKNERAATEELDDSDDPSQTEHGTSAATGEHAQPIIDVANSPPSKPQQGTKRAATDELDVLDESPESERSTSAASSSSKRPKIDIATSKHVRPVTEVPDTSPSKPQQGTKRPAAVELDKSDDESQTERSTSATSPSSKRAKLDTATQQHAQPVIDVPDSPSFISTSPAAPIDQTSSPIDDVANGVALPSIEEATQPDTPTFRREDAPPPSSSNTKKMGIPTSANPEDVANGTALPTSKKVAEQAQRLRKKHVTDQAKDKKRADHPPEFWEKRNLSKAEKEEGPVRCVCGATADDGTTADDGWAGCDKEECKSWQHSSCVGEAWNGDEADYECHRCDPFAHKVVLQKIRAQGRPIERV